MSNSLKRKLENVLQLLERLAKESDKGVPIIVEGRKDIAALRKLNINGNVISAKSSGKSFVDVLSEAKSLRKEEIILLLDFDRPGIEWTKRIAHRLERTKMKSNIFFWRRLRNIVGKDVKDIEGLTSYLETLKKKCGD